MARFSFKRLFALHSRRELRELYLFQLLFSFAFSLITIFEPVFFFQLGRSLPHIALYYALHYVLYILLMPLGAKVAARFGLERSLALSTPLFVIYFLLLAAMPLRPELFWWALVILTLHKIFYWPAYHADFAQHADGRNRGTEQSWMRLITQGSGIAGPLLGGFVALHFGFPVLFLLAAVTVLAAGIPLLSTREQLHAVTFPYTAAWKIIASAQHRRMVIAMCGWAEDLILLVFWPIWMYVILGSTDKIGIAAAIGVTCMTIWGFAVGDLIDRRGSRWVLRRWGVPFLVITNALRFLAVTPWRVTLVNTASYVANINLTLPFTAQLHADAKRHGALKYAVAFETVLAIAKATTAFLLVIIFMVSPDSGFAIAFLMATVFSFLYIFL